MNSKLYIGQVQHERLQSVHHLLKYPAYLYCLDLDELPELDRRLPLFGYNCFRPASIHDRDYLDQEPGTIKEKLLRYLEREGYARGTTTVMLVTSARYFNYIFNPVSFYYCFSGEGDLVCTVAEVNNTFGERHLYIPQRMDKEATGFPARFSAPKQFHVSPFNDLSGTYEFLFSDIRKDLSVRINLLRDGELAFYAELQGTPVPLSPARHTGMLLRHPMLPHLTVPRIYREAARLYFARKLSYHDKPVPKSMMTIRRNPPTIFQKRSMKYIVGLMEQVREGSLSVRLPDGSLRTFGAEGAHDPADMTVHDYGFFTRVILGGDVGLGEAYVDELWDSPDPAQVMTAFIKNREIFSDGSFVTAAFSRLRDRTLHFARENTLNGARRNIRRHYDLSNDFYKLFLDPSMTYSCGIFNSPEDTLEEAQRNKYRAIIEKAGISADDQVLEIGCGWGGFAIEAVKETGCRVTGITISKAQYDYARRRIHDEGLERHITVHLMDYRYLKGRFDKIVSIEMLEAVGHRRLGAFFRRLDGLLREHGRIVLQTIAIPDQRYDSYRKSIDWIRKHIFPGGHLPSLGVLGRAMRDHSSLVIDDVENIGPHYARTLREWRHRFQEHIDSVRALGFDRSFCRKWEFYLASCEATFATRYLGDLQLVLGRPG